MAERSDNYLRRWKLDVECLTMIFKRMQGFINVYVPID